MRGCRRRALRSISPVRLDGSRAEDDGEVATRATLHAVLARHTSRVRGQQHRRARRERRAWRRRVVAILMLRQQRGGAAEGNDGGGGRDAWAALAGLQSMHLTALGRMAVERWRQSLRQGGRPRHSKACSRHRHRCCANPRNGERGNRRVEQVLKCNLVYGRAARMLPRSKYTNV